ncbi:MAG TPA: [protein-PII] uridylyltransferase [Jatrophihabitantaceae bacterium]
MSGTPTRSELAEVRAGVLRRPGLVGAPLREALSDAYDSWLASLPTPDGVALAAVGGLGRREPSPYGDLDLVLLHSGKVRGLARLADRIWYPIWDSGVALDHSVRTPEQALAVARDDLKALLGLLDVRHVAGDATLTAALRVRLLDLWRSGASKRAEELRSLSVQRAETAGDAAFLLEPHLKDARGGLRDAQALQALARAQLVDIGLAAREAYAVLLDVRGELHRLTGRVQDVLHQQEQSGVASALRLSGADTVLRAVNEAARTIGHATDTAWRRVPTRTVQRGWSVRRLLSAPGPARTPLAKDVVMQDGDVVLARDADPWADPLLTLRAARAAAEHDRPLAPFTLERLATESAPMPLPWPDAARDDFIGVLGAGAAGIPVMESLDQAGLLVRLIPEWDAVRFTPQHNPVHRFTVDRHLLEAAAEGAAHTREVARPDLLLLGALLHDIGKGFDPADHSRAGAGVAEQIANRMGLSYGDAATVTALVRHHLLLPDTATRRDLDDPVTIKTVTSAVGGSAELLELLSALTVADAAATGPAAWSDWKASLIAELVRRARAALGGEPALPALPPLDEHRRSLAEAGVLSVEIDHDGVVVAAPDSLGVLSKAAGVLALHSLDVRSATIRTYHGMAVNAFVVEPRFGSLPDPAVVRGDLGRAIEGTLPIAERLAAKERAYQRGTSRRPPTVHWFDGEATDATVVELRADDAIGLLYRVTAALERCHVDIRSARVSSLGGSVVDAFYVTTLSGAPIPKRQRRDIEAALMRSG